MVAGDGLLPGQQGGSVKVPILDGGVFSFVPGAGSVLVVHALDSADAFSMAMWRANYSVDSFLVDLSENGAVTESTVTLMASFGGATGSDTDAAKETAWMRSRLVSRAAAMGWDKARSERVLSTIAFASTAVHNWDGASWVAPTLEAWPQNVTVLRGPGLSGPVTRLDGEYTVYPWPAEPSTGPLPVVDGGYGCGPSSADAAGGALLLAFEAGQDGRPSSDGNCSFAGLARKASGLNASVAILYAATPGVPLAQPNCTSGSNDCAGDVSAAPTVVSHADGAAMAAAIASGVSSATVSLDHTPRHAMELVVLRDGRLQQAGWRKFASLRILSWAAQFAAYTGRLATNLTLSTSVVEAFGPTRLQGREGIVVNLTLPPRASVLTPGGTVQVDMTLGCPGPLDESCPVWDRTLRLWACCWDAAAPVDTCSRFELGRWITPFRRGVGRWLTDVSPIAAALFPAEHSACSLQLQTDWWASAWMPSLRLRFGAPPAAGAAGVEAWGPSNATTALFSGGKFDKTYNSNRTVSLERPAWARRAALVAVITGHGSDNNGCGEFCVTEHVFRIAGTNRSVTFGDAGDFWGSTFSVVQGTIPSQHGTWHYGRDGWFDGNKVRPWLVDVTDLLPDSGSFDVRYWGLFQGRTPDPTSSPGEITMSSWVAWWA